jgi:hypothetical protein
MNMNELLWDEYDGYLGWEEEEVEDIEDGHCLSDGHVA